MKKIEATIQVYKLEAVQDALVRVGVDGMSISEVRTADAVHHPRAYRGVGFSVDFAPRLKLELLVDDAQAARCVELISRSARGADGADGEIVVLGIADAVRIRTGEHLAADTPLPSTGYRAELRSAANLR